MLKLNTKAVKAHANAPRGTSIAKITVNTAMPKVLRGTQLLLATKVEDLTQTDFAGILCLESKFEEWMDSADCELEQVMLIPDYLSFLGDGDVVRFDASRGALNVL